MLEKKQGTARGTGAASARWAGVKSKLAAGGAAGKDGEEKKTVASRRAGGYGAVGSRLNTGRASVRPGAGDKSEESTASGASGSSRATAGKERSTVGFRGRNTSASRDKDITGLNRTRGTSKDKASEM